MTSLLSCLALTGCSDDLLDFLQKIEQGQCSGSCGKPDTGSGTTGLDSSAPGTGSDSANLTSSPNSPTGALPSSDDSGPTSSSSCEDKTAPSRPCEEGQQRVHTCEKCGTQSQICEQGRWIDQGDCEEQRVCEPGELWINDRHGRFDCGPTMIIMRCDVDCYPKATDDLPYAVLVSACQPENCCGGADGARVACLDPDNLPQGGFCRTPPPNKDAIGRTWMTRDMWTEFLARITQDNENSPR